MKGLLFITVLLVFAVGCKKPVEEPVDPGPQMPGLTETGANILACKVNGDVRVYRGKFDWNHPDGVTFRHAELTDKYTYIRADDSKPADNVYIAIYTWDIVVGKEYVISRDDAPDFGRYYVGSGTIEHTYVTENSSGWVKFSRHDSLVAAGTFSFTAANPGGEKVEITEGFFDISRKE